MKITQRFFVNIYVGNLSYQTTEEGLKTAFERFGEVRSAKIIRDRDTKRSKGFGFVEMDNDEAARAAIAELHDKELDGRALRVNESEPKK